MITGSYNYFDEQAMFRGSLMNIMGTRFDMVLIGKKKEESILLWSNISDELKRLHRMLDRFDPESEVSKINQYALRNFVPLSNELWDVLQDCKRYHQRTLGLFDITLHDFDKIQFCCDKQSLMFQLDNQSLDLGGYAKGYALKILVNMMREHHVEDCFVDFGKSAIFALGSHPYGNCWKVSVENPFLYAVGLYDYHLRNKALSTSGNTPSYSGHIVNPFNGKHNNKRIMICVECDDPLDAEVLSTTLMVANGSQKRDILNIFTNIEVREFDL